MKRAGRWLFNFAAAVSLVLCAASIAIWATAALPPRVTLLFVYQIQRILGQRNMDLASANWAPLILGRRDEQPQTFAMADSGTPRPPGAQKV